MRFVLVNNVDSCCDGCYGALVTSSRYGHCWSMTFDNAKIRNMKSPLRRFYAIRGFLYVSMRFYTLGTLTRISLHTDLTDHTDFLHKLFLNTNNSLSLQKECDAVA